MQLYFENPEEENILLHFSLGREREREGHRGRQTALTGERKRRKFILTLCVENHTAALQCLQGAEPQATSEGLRARAVNCCFRYILSVTVLPYTAYSSCAIFYKYAMHISFALRHKSNSQ